MQVGAGAHTYREITTQAESWRGALAAVDAQAENLSALLALADESGVLFIGCGSTYYLAQFVAPYTQALTGLACRAAPSSEVRWQSETLLRPGQVPLVVALSRSGETSETILAVEALRARGSRVITVSCYDDTPLARASTLTVHIPAGREYSLAQTRSFAGMLVASQAMAAAVAGDGQLRAALGRLPDLAPELVARAEPLARRYGQDETIQRLTLLGSGPLYGLASEGTVKLKEMSLSLAEPYHFMEFRHGPMALVDEHHLLIGLLGERMHALELDVLAEMAGRGGRVLALAEAVPENATGEVFAFGSGLSEAARAVLYLPLIQLMAYYRAVGRGLDPDRPRHLSMAVRLPAGDENA